MELVRNTNLSNEIEELRDYLTSVRLQDLREIARHWNWPLKGNAKTDIVEQMVGYYTDPARQKSMLASLSSLQIEGLHWMEVITQLDPTATLQSALKIAGGHDLSTQAVEALVEKLRKLGLIFDPEYDVAGLPQVILDLLPPVAAPGLVHSGPLEPAEMVTLQGVTEAVNTLLAKIEADRPMTTDAAAKAPSLLRGNAEQPGGPVIGPRSGLVPTATLADWGYHAERQRDQARFFLALMVMGRLYGVDQQSKRLVPLSRQLQAWQDQPPENRLGLLFNWWIQASPEMNDPAQPRTWLSWHELDLALRHTEGYQLRWSGGWTGANEIQESDLLTTRRWLTTIVSTLQADIWYDVNSFCNLVYHLHRDLMRWNPYLAAMIWHKDRLRLEALKMDFKTWNATNGALVRAWLAGPASWLGLVQVGYGGNAGADVVAFQRPGPNRASEPIEVPADALTYLPDGKLMLRNIWQVGAIRPLIGRMAVERARQREVTLYEPNTAAFRKALNDGGSAEQIIQSFAEIGFPLPPTIAAQLRGWQQHAGRHRIYDDVAVIEFADDLALREVLAATGLEARGAYVLSPRCLVLLNPDIVGDVMDELNRKGYNPRLIQPEITGSAPR
jgi:hypothetical protein